MINEISPKRTFLNIVQCPFNVTLVILHTKSKSIYGAIDEPCGILILSWLLIFQGCPADNTSSYLGCLMLILVVSDKRTSFMPHAAG